ncbi:4-hydroxy-3-methylbut-2-enyl diphosphate reductase [Patescibacteria group bacterium]|nr:4-hydroxy-3-methylbut-2-enyl diphosphate reductase [Patescibacteria group bacterium]
MKIVFAKEVGFCFGVRRALKMVQDNLSNMKKPINVYGSLIHNEEVIRDLEKKGVKIVKNLKNIDKGTLIISTHGLSVKIKEKLRKIPNLDLLDTTCPLVISVHNKVKLLQKEGRQVLIFGDSNHQEVLGIKSFIKGEPFIFSSKKELLEFKPDKSKKYGLVSQTTQNFEKFKEIEKVIKKKIPKVEIYNTICETSFKRQMEIMALAKETDMVLIIGSLTSANSKRLFQTSLKINPNTYLVQTFKELKREWFKGKKSVGIGTGASTPDKVITAVVKKVKSF